MAYGFLSLGAKLGVPMYSLAFSGEGVGPEYTLPSGTVR